VKCILKMILKFTIRFCFRMDFLKERKMLVKQVSLIFFQTAVAKKLDKLNNRFQKNFKQADFTKSICKLLRTLRNIQDHFDEQ